MSSEYKRSPTTLSVREARAQFATIISQAAASGTVSIVTKYNTPVAMIVPISTKDRQATEQTKIQKALDAAAGIWADRTESTAAVSARLRNATNRYEKIFD